MSTETLKEIENKAILKNFLEELWLKRNFHIIDEVFSPNIIYHGPSLELHNLDELKTIVNGFLTAFHDAEMKIKQQIAKDDMVVTRFEFEGVHKGNLDQLPPTNKKVKVKGITIDYIVDGKVVEEWESYDGLDMMQQLGLELRPMEVAH